MSNISRIYVADKVTKKQARQAVARDHGRRKGKRLEAWKMNAMQRRSECQKIALHRAAAPGGRGNGIGWAWVVGNMVRVLQGSITVQSLRAEVGGLGLPPIDPAIINQVVTEIGGKAWGEYRLYGPDVAGANLALTTAERELLGITKIDAVDEPRDERVRRLARERKAAERAAKAASRSTEKQSIATLSQALGKHRNTISTWIREGKLDPETGELRDCAIAVTRSSRTPFSYREDPVTENAQSGASATSQQILEQSQPPDTRSEAA